jgi:predicted phosphodiesterase
MKDLHLSRRKFVSSLGVLGAAGLTLPALKTEAAGQSSFPPGQILKAGPYLQALQQEQVIIRWITHVPAYSWVEYGQEAGKLNQQAQEIQNGMMVANNTINAIKLKDLEPGATYYYRIVSREIKDFKPYALTYGDTFQSEIYNFSTPSTQAESVNFIVFNDIHDRPKSFGDLMKLASPEKKDFAFLNGDMFDFQTDENQLVNHLINPLCELFASSTPFILSRGNHETRGKFSRQLPQYFDGRNHPYYYSFELGPAYFIVLDSGEDKKDDTEVYAGIVDFDNYRIEQAEWLKKEVQHKAFKKAKFKIVFSHIPLYHSGDWHGTTHCREVWGSVLNQAKIDVLISGHTHTHGIHAADQNTHHYPIVIGGGPAEGKRTLIEVKVNNKVLDLKMTDDSGKEVGKLHITSDR